MQKPEHVDLVRADTGRRGSDQDPPGGQSGAEKGRDNSRAQQEDGVPHSGSHCDRPAPAGERSGEGGSHLCEPWTIASVSPRHTPWRERYFVIDATGWVVAIFDDEKIARRVIDLINAVSKK